jgi:GNAT superfamily N-acetyltransferase
MGDAFNRQRERFPIGGISRRRIDNSMVDVRQLAEYDGAWANEVEAQSWSTHLGGEPVGLASYAVRGHECELVTIRSLREGRGVGRALFEAVRNAAIDAGCTRLWPITTNDNLRALDLCQRWGMEIVAFYRDAVTEARRNLKPSPERGAHGIPVSHEVELELRLHSPEGSSSFRRPVRNLTP